MVGYIFNAKKVVTLLTPHIIICLIEEMLFIYACILLFINKKCCFSFYELLLC